MGRAPRPSRSTTRRPRPFAAYTTSSTRAGRRRWCTRRPSCAFPSYCRTAPGALNRSPARAGAIPRRSSPAARPCEPRSLPGARQRVRAYAARRATADRCARIPAGLGDPQRRVPVARMGPAGGEHAYRGERSQARYRRRRLRLARARSEAAAVFNRAMVEVTRLVARESRAAPISPASPASWTSAEATAS